MGALKVIDSSGNLLTATGDVPGEQVTGTPLWKPQSNNQGKIFAHSTTPLTLGGSASQGIVFVGGVGTGASFGTLTGALQMKHMQAERIAASQTFYIGTGAAAKEVQIDSQGYPAIKALSDRHLRDATLSNPSVYYRYNGLSSTILQVKMKKNTFQAVREGRRVVMSGLFHPYNTSAQLGSTAPTSHTFKKPNAGGGLLLYYEATHSSLFESLFTFDASNSDFFAPNISLVKGVVYGYASTYQYQFALVENLYLHASNRILYIRLRQKDHGLLAATDVNLNNLVIDIEYYHTSDEYLN